MNTEWISVTERMPKVGTTVLAITEEGYVRLVAYGPFSANRPATEWYDDEGDAGYFVAWAPFEEPTGDFKSLLKRWEVASGRE